MRVSGREREHLAAVLDAALRAEPAVRVRAARRVRREHPFAFSLSDSEPLISGVIDLLAEERDGCAIVLDYKSTAVAPGEDLAALVERDYALQRHIYALAVLLSGAPHVEVVHWFLERPDGHVAARYAARERGSLEDLIGHTLARVRSSGFAVSSDPHRALCLTCPARAALCSWPAARTLAQARSGP